MLPVDHLPRRGTPRGLAALGLVAAIIIAIAALTAAPWGVIAQENEDVENPFANDPEGIAYGNKRYHQRCGYCHGGGGKGAEGPALTSGKFYRGSRNIDLVSNIIGGIPNTQMGGFGNYLDGDEVWKIIAYLRDETERRRAAGEIK